MAGTQRVVFTFDERSLAALRAMVEQAGYPSMAEAVRESIAVNSALQGQAAQGFRARRGRARLADPVFRLGQSVLRKVLWSA